MAIAVYIVEDHPVMRAIVSDYLASDPDFEVVGCAGTGEQALDRLDALDLRGEMEAEIALIDTSLPGMTGIELVKELTAKHPGLQCLMYSGHGEEVYVERALAVGARGYIVKNGDPAELPEGIRRVARGEMYFSKGLHGAG